jgi:hypothetical protein
VIITFDGNYERDYEGSSFLNDHDKERPKKDHPKGPQPWHLNATCRNCLKKGHVAAFCGDAKTATTNVQDGQVTHEEAAQQLLDGSDDENENCYADLFLCDDQDHRSVSFQLKDAVDGGRIPKCCWVLIDSQSTTDACSNPEIEGHS